MKYLFILVTVFVFSISLSAQEETAFVRKGKVLIETGYGFIGGFSSGTGVTMFSVKDPITTIGADVGYFVNNNLALKLNVNSLTGGSGLSLSSLTFGAKYYFFGVAPMQLMAGTQRVGSNSALVATLNIGYGIKLADNIYLEPTVGLWTDISNDDGELTFKLSFAMFL